MPNWKHGCEKRTRPQADANGRPQQKRLTEKCLQVSHAKWQTQASNSFFCPFFIFLSEVLTSELTVPSLTAKMQSCFAALRRSHTCTATWQFDCCLVRIDWGPYL